MSAVSDTSIEVAELMLLISRQGLLDVSSPFSFESIITDFSPFSVHDGWGLSDVEKGNAVFHGETTNMDSIRDTHNSTKLEAHGLAVGLKEGLMGNSEVG